jgi:hypothetical protein
LLSLSTMDCRTTVAVLAVVGALASAAPARAHEGESQPVLFTLDPGICLVYNGTFLHSRSASPISVVYLGGTLQFDLPGPLAANVFAGVGGCFTKTAGGTIRYTTRWNGALRLTAGVGPMIGDGPTAIAAGDAALEIRFGTGPGFALAVGPKLLVTLNPSGGDKCDNCVQEVPAGTYAVIFRIGVGFHL